MADTAQRVLIVLAVIGADAAFYVLNRRLVERKGLDHRPWFVPSLWGPLGTLLIVLAEPRGWARRP